MCEETWKGPYWVCWSCDEPKQELNGQENPGRCPDCGDKLHRT